MPLHFLSQGPVIHLAAGVASLCSMTRSVQTNDSATESLAMDYYIIAPMSQQVLCDTDGIDVTYLYDKQFHCILHLNDNTRERLGQKASDLIVSFVEMFNNAVN